MALVRLAELRQAVHVLNNNSQHFGIRRQRCQERIYRQDSQKVTQPRSLLPAGLFSARAVTGVEQSSAGKARQIRISFGSHRKWASASAGAPFIFSAWRAAPADPLPIAGSFCRRPTTRCCKSCSRRGACCGCRFPREAVCIHGSGRSLLEVSTERRRLRAASLAFCRR